MCIFGHFKEIWKLPCKFNIMWLVLLIQLYHFSVNAASKICVPFATSNLISGLQFVTHAAFACREQKFANYESIEITYSLEMYSFCWIWNSFYLLSICEPENWTFSHCLLWYLNFCSVSLHNTVNFLLPVYSSSST